MNQADYSRQSDLVNMAVLQGLRATVIGAGAVGSYSALALAKMGLGTIEVYDDDVVAPHNLPNQFFRNSDTGKLKVDALAEILADFTDATVEPHADLYNDQELYPVVIVAVDSMAARRVVWEQFKGSNAQVYIEARMGGQLGAVYTIRKAQGVLSEEDKLWYEQYLYDDSEADPVRCTEKSIIYNVQMISSLICRALRAVIMREEGYPKEFVFDMHHMQTYSQETLVEEELVEIEADVEDIFDEDEDENDLDDEFGEEDEIEYEVIT